MSLLERLSFHKPKASERINTKRMISEKTNLEKKRGNELFDRLETKESEKISEEKKKLVDKEVTKLREYEKLGLIGE